MLPAHGDGGHADDDACPAALTHAFGCPYNARSAARLMMLPLSGTGSPDWVELAFIVRDALLMRNRNVSALGGKQERCKLLREAS